MVNSITEHIDIWTTAQTQKNNVGRGHGKNSNGQSPHGIKKLRELILELAVHGKLVPQDPKDEPASVLLEKVAKEKAQLIKAGKIKKQKLLPDISEDEKPFELPVGWEFVRFGNATFNRDAERVPLSVEERRGRQGKFDYYGASGVIDSIDDYLFEEPFLLIGEDGANLINRSTPIAFMARGKYWVNNHAHVIDGLTEELLLYICLHINAISLEPYITGTAQPKMNQAKMNSIILALPPLAEQHRIVAKVAELMALCGQLEQQQTDSNATHQTLVETLLATLTNAADQKESAKAWQRISKNFDTLFATEQNIDQLKQTILQLAVMGKLVPQDPNDESASDLLEKIVKEKARLIKEGKLKKQKKLPEISEEEKPFGLPMRWSFSRLGDFTVVGTGATPTRSNPDYFFPPEINWVTSGETSGDFIKETKEKISPLAVSETNVTVYPNGTLIVAMYGQGKTRGQVSELLVEAGTNQACAAIQPVALEVHHRKYIKLFFKKAYEELRSHAAGGAQPNLNVGKVAQTLIPLPPLAEQHRIVAKVDELMALCDTLKARLNDAQTTQVQLADAIVKQAVV